MTEPPIIYAVQQTIGYKEDNAIVVDNPIRTHYYRVSRTVRMAYVRKGQKNARANAVQLALILSKLGCNVTYLHIFWQEMLYI